MREHQEAEERPRRDAQRWRVVLLGPQSPELQADRDRLLERLHEVDKRPKVEPG